MQWLRLAPVGATLSVALLGYGCGSPHVQQSGIVAAVRVVGGSAITVNQPPHVFVTLTAESNGFSESRQVLTGNEGVTVRIDLPPGRYVLTEAIGGNVPCSNQTVVVSAGVLEPAHLSCDIR